jgi:putative membrane protein
MSIAIGNGLKSHLLSDLSPKHGPSVVKKHLYACSTERINNMKFNKNYRSSNIMTTETPPPPPPPSSSGTSLSTIKTYILIAFIFSILFMIVWIAGALWTIAVFATATYFGVGIFFVLPAIFYLVWFAFSVIVFLRIYKMYKAVNAGDIATLKAESNIIWAILALIFAGVIPGIMLIISDGPIKQL